MTRLLTHPSVSVLGPSGRIASGVSHYRNIVVPLRWSFCIHCGGGNLPATNTRKDRGDAFDLASCAPNGRELFGVEPQASGLNSEVYGHQISTRCKYFASLSLRLLTLMNPSHLILPTRLSRNCKSSMSWNSPSIGIFKVIRMTPSRTFRHRCAACAYALGFTQNSYASLLMCRRRARPCLSCCHF